MKIKKIIASALLLCMVASLTACGSKEKTPEEEFSDSLNSAYNSIKNWASSASSELSKSYKYSSNSISSEESSEISTNLKKIDPFKNLKITYTGSSPYIKASTDSTQCDSTVNKYFEFKTLLYIMQTILKKMVFILILILRHMLSMLSQNT